MSDTSSMPEVESFVKAKKMAKPGRVSGGGSRAVYYRHPERVQVIRGRNVNGASRSAPASPSPGAG